MRKIFSALFIFVSLLAFGQRLEIPDDRTMNPYIYTGFVLSYSEEHEQAEWVAYELTAEEAQGEIKRTDNFREDPNISSGTATLEDYRGSGYDRGHLAPAGDMAWSQQSMEDSFYFSNMSPQDPGFNRVDWRLLEAMVREWAIEYGSLYIVTGPILQDNLPTIGPNEVAVPNWYFKAILYFDGEEGKAIGFIVPNERLEYDIEYYSYPIDFLELILKIDLFYMLEDSIEEEIESTYNFSDW